MTTRQATSRGNGQRGTGNAFREIGTSGTQSGKFGDQSEFLPDLRGTRAVKIYREMSDNDATIGSLLFAIDMLLRAVEWEIIPGGTSSADEEAALFLEECRDDMSHSWTDLISSILTMLPYGWCWLETVYKRRLGPQPEDGPLPSSKFDDGRIGWRKHAYRPQESLAEFLIDSGGGTQGMVQTVGFNRVTIPIAKSLHFRTTTARGNPMGRSMLRNAYRSWFFKKMAEEIAMIGLRRDLNGIFVGKIPAENIIAQDDVWQEVKNIATRMKVDEQQGLVWPWDVDPDTGLPMYDFDILSTSGRPKIDAIQLIRMFAVDILSTVLAEMLALGRDAVGARALAEPKQELFRAALQAWLDSIADVLNRHAVPRLFAMNTFTVEALPEFKPGEVQDVDLTGLAEAVFKFSQAGIPIWSGDPDDPIIAEVRQMLGFEPLPDDIKIAAVDEQTPMPGPQQQEQEVPAAEPA